MKISRFLRYMIHKLPGTKLYHIYSHRSNLSNYGIVITLHRVTEIRPDGLNNFIEIKKENFERLICALIRLKVQFVSLKELERILSEPKPDAPLVHISFDDGYLDNYTTAFPILKKYNIPFSIFIVSSFINDDQPFLWWYGIEQLIIKKAEIKFVNPEFSINSGTYYSRTSKEIFEMCRSFVLEHLFEDGSSIMNKLKTLFVENNIEVPPMLAWSEIKEMLSSGLCEVGAHSVNHAVYRDLNTEQKIEEINNCVNVIQSNTQYTPVYFSYPFGGMEEIGKVDDIEIVMGRTGIKMAFTTIAGELNGKRNKYLLPRVFINNSWNLYTLKTRLNGSYQRYGL